MGTTTIETLQVQLKADVDDLRKQMDAARKSLGKLELGSKETREELEKLSKAGTSLQSSFGGLKSLFAGLGTAYIGKKLIDIGKSSVQMAMDVVESESLFETSMGSMAGAAREWSEQLSESLGLNAYELRQNVGIMYNMTKSMGIAGDTAYDLSTSLVLLAQDMASFYNMDTEEAFVKLRAGITGETEPLKALGILVDENTVSQYAYQNSLAETGEELTQQQKVLARYYAILDQTSTAQGDLARTIESPANQLRIFQAQLEQTRIELGMGLLPVLQEVMPYMIALAQKLTEIIGALFGVEKAANAVSSSLGGADYSSISQATESENELGDAIEETDKKLKKSLTGFDEINKLSAGSESLADQMGLTGEDLSFDIPTLGGDLGLKSLWDDEKMQKAKEDIDGIFEVIGNLRGVLIGLVGYKVIKGLGSLKSGISGLSGTTGKLAKGTIGAGGLIVAFDSTRTAGKKLAKMLDGGDGSMTTAIASLVTGGAGAIVGGAMIGGPIGALAGGLVAVGGAITGIAENYWDAGIASIYDDIGITAEQFAVLAEGVGETIREQATPLEEYKNSAKSLQEQYQKLSETFRVESQSINMNADSTNEDIESVISSLSEMVGIADEKLRLTTDTAISEYRKLFLENDGIISEEEKKVLAKMEENYSTQKTRLGEIQSEITHIFETAMQTRGYLLDDEIKQIQGLMDQIADLSDFETNVGIIEQEAVIEDLRSGKIKLSQDQFETFIAEQAENINELIEQARSNYATQLALAKTTTGGTGAEYETAAKVARENYEKQVADLSSQLDHIIDAIGSQFQDVASTYDKYHHDSGVIDALDTAGAALGGLLGWAGLEDEYGDTGWEHLENKAAAEAAKEALDQLESLRQQYKLYEDVHTGIGGKFATGGFPEDGLFYANSQELVGRFSNGRTAVANNLQILEGIKQAVLEALQTVGGMDGGNWTIQVVDTDGNIKAEQIISAAERRNRRDGRTILPLGD